MSQTVGCRTPAFERFVNIKKTVNKDNPIAIIIPRPDGEEPIEARKPLTKHAKTRPSNDCSSNNNNNRSLPASPTSSWIQCSGHEGAFLPSKAGTIWKKVPYIKGKNEENYEIEAYKKLMTEDNIRDFIPSFYSEVDFEDDHFMEIQDLLFQFKNHSASCVGSDRDPLYIMDIKMGTRTFLEKEASCPTQRSDLYDKMVKVDSNEPTHEEHAKKSVTKLRYMSFRESLSSSLDMGFRIEGCQVCIMWLLLGKT